MFQLGDLFQKGYQMIEKTFKALIESRLVTG